MFYAHVMVVRLASKLQMIRNTSLHIKIALVVSGTDAIDISQACEVAILTLSIPARTPAPIMPPSLDSRR